MVPASCHQSPLSTFRAVVHELWYCSPPNTLVEKGKNTGFLTNLAGLRTHNLTLFALFGSCRTEMIEKRRNLGNGRNAVSRALFQKRELTEFLGKLTDFLQKKNRWVRFCTQITGWEELTELSPRNSARATNLTEFGVFETVLSETVFGLFPKIFSNAFDEFWRFLRLWGQILYTPTPHPWKYPSRGVGRIQGEGVQNSCRVGPQKIHPHPSPWKMPFGQKWGEGGGGWGVYNFSLERWPFFRWPFLQSAD